MWQTAEKGSTQINTSFGKSFESSLFYAVPVRALIEYSNILSYILPKICIYRI